MTQNLKIEVLTGDISIDGMVVTNLVTKEELSTAIVKKADLGADGKIPTSQLPAEIVNTAGIVDEVKLQLETSIKDAVDESNAYAESYTDNALTSKADLTSGKVPLEQLPAIDQYPQFGTALSNLSTSILTSVKQRTDQLEKSKADLGEDGKVLREQIPSYEKISGLPEQLEVMSTQTAAVSGELDQHKLQTADQIDTLKENINTNSEFLMESISTQTAAVSAAVSGELDDHKLQIETMTERLEGYADKNAVKRGIANRYDSSLTYNSGERVILSNGDIVKSTINGNTNDPNSDTSVWSLDSLTPSKNLSDLPDVSVSRNNLSVYSESEVDDIVAGATTPSATETIAGKAKIATTAIAQAGTNDTDFLTAKKLRDALNASGDAPVYACRAWVHFNGVGVVSVIASGNVSSVTDNGVGDYTLNFATPMPNANYSISSSSTELSDGTPLPVSLRMSGTTPLLKSTSAVRVSTRSTYNSTLLDVNNISVQVFC